MDKLNFWVEKKTDTKNYGQFVISPLPAGFGHTIGNSLRRVLLGYMPGSAITQIKVKGANHPFAVLPGVKEDLIDIITNIKQIRVAYSGERSTTITLEKSGPGKVLTGDIQLKPNIKILNPDLVLAELADRRSSLKIDFKVEKGVNYSLADSHKTGKMNWIAIDAIFTPITKCNYVVKEIRVGKREDMNQIILDIWTDGTIKPSEALKKAAEILQNSFSTILNPPEKKKVKKSQKEENNDFNLYLEELDLPLRLVNALKKAGYKKLADLEGKSREELMKIKNVGEKSSQQLIKVLKAKGVNIQE